MPSTVPALSVIPVIAPVPTPSALTYMLPVGGGTSNNNVGSAVVGGVVGGIAGTVLVFGTLGYAMYRAERRKRLRRMTVKAVQEKNPAVRV